jgi:hypothetical protein
MTDAHLCIHSLPAIADALAARVHGIGMPDGRLMRRRRITSRITSYLK